MLKKTKITSLIIAFCLILIIVSPMEMVQAATSSEKSVTVVIDGKNPYCTYNFKLKKSTKLKVTVKILNISGKPKGKVDYWGYCGTNTLKGSLFYDTKKTKFKKGNTLVSEEWASDYEASHLKYGGATFNLPDGVKRMKIKIIISTVGGTKSIKSFKKSKDMY